MSHFYGARDIDRPIPNGAIHLQPTQVPGEAQHLFDTAMHDVLDGGTIVVHGGIWPISVLPPRRKNFDLIGEPGNRPTFDGTSASLPWAREGDEWWTPWTPFDATPNSPNIIDHAHPLASIPERVLVDGQRARLMPLSNVVTLGPLEFTVGPDRLWVGADPAGHEIRVSVRQRAFMANPDGNTRHTIEGIDWFGYAPSSMQRAAITLFGPYSRITDCRITDCAQAAISARADTILVMYCDIVRAGQLGVHGYQADGLQVARCHIDQANHEQFSHIAEAGASKVSACEDVWWSDNLITGHDGHGLWADLGSHRARWTGNDIRGTGTSAGVMNELSDGGLAIGNRITGHEIGILGANTADFGVLNNTATGNRTQDILFRPDNRRAGELQHGNTAWNNDTSGTQPTDPADPPQPIVVELLDLPAELATQPHLGWYGPTPIQPPPPQEEPPVAMPYDTDSMIQDLADLDFEVHEAVVEIRRLEAVEASNVATITEQENTIEAGVAEVARLQALIDSDDHLAQIAALTATRDQLAKDLLNTTKQRDTLTKTVDTLNTTVTNLHGQVDSITAERDSALAAEDKLQADVDTLEASLEEQVDLNAEQARRIAELEAQLAHDDVDLVVGGSHPNGWQALKQMIAPAVPEAYRMFSSAPTITTAQATSIGRIINDDHAVPYLSLTKPSVAATPDTPSPDVVTTVQRLIAANVDTMHGALTLVHEPTTKMTAAEFRAMVTANYPYLRAHLPGWHLSLVFQRYDFNGGPTGARWPGLYLPDDLTLIDSIGVDAYDKLNADANGEGQTFAVLMAEAEAFARSIGKPISIWEASAPDTGQYGRRAGWKAQWLDDAFDHMLGQDLPDGSPLYMAFLAFNGLGPDAPPAVTGPPAIPQGWTWASTEEALEGLRRAIESQS